MKKMCLEKAYNTVQNVHAPELFGRLGKGSDYLLRRLFPVFGFCYGRLCRGRTLVDDPELKISSTAFVLSLCANIGQMQCE